MVEWRAGCIRPYMPAPDWSTPLGDGPRDTWASDSFTYRATDGELWSDPATYWIWVKQINDPPTFDFTQQVHVEQDSGAYSAQWATNIDPGRTRTTRRSFELSIESHEPGPLRGPSGDRRRWGPDLYAGTAPIGRGTLFARAKDDGGLEDWQVPHDI